MFRVKSGSHFKEVVPGERKILRYRKRSVARKHPDAEYKHLGVFVAVIIYQATEKRPWQYIHVKQIFDHFTYYTSILSFFSLDVFSESPTIGLRIFASS